MCLRECLVAAWLAACSASWAQAPPPTAAQVREAAEAVHKDPLLHSLKAKRELRFKKSEEPEPPQAQPPRWWIDALRWFTEAGRWLVWLVGAAAVALLLLNLRRWMARRADEVGARALALPSHVNELDIRPSSLPDDLAGHVRALWQRGEARAALSLLYRGALSRLVHDHGVPVRAASTEGECARLAARHLSAESGAFVAQLIAIWQRAVYGARLPDSAQVLGLCDDFEARLPRRTQPQGQAA